MKQWILSALALGAGAACAQGDAAASQRAAMEKVAWMAGQWEGRAVTREREGEKKSVSSETVRPAAGGLAILIQGRHWRELEGGQRGDVVHETAGMLTFDPASGKYKFATQLADGKAGSFEGEMKDGVFSWRLPLPNAHVRYDIARENEQWNERGYYCRDGAPCVPVFRMVLDRKGDAP